MAIIRPLPHGARVIYNPHHGKKTHIVFAIALGEADMPLQYNGWLHFDEHLRGMRRERHYELVRDEDRRQIDSNAYTGRDIVYFHMSCRHRDVLDIVGRVADMTFGIGMDWTPDTIDQERKRVVEEWHEYADDHGTAAAWLSDRIMYGDHPIGRDEIGSKASIERITWQRFLGFWARMLDPRKIIVVISGRFDREAVHTLLSKRVASLEIPTHPFKRRVLRAPAHGTRHVVFRRRPISQVHFAWCIRLPGFGTPNRLAYSILANVLGGRESSRLNFQLMSQGLAYSFDVIPWHYPEVGEIAICSRVTPEQLQDVLRRIRNELIRYREFGMTADEFDDAVIHLRERAKGRVTKLSYAQLLAGQLASHGQVIENPAFLRQLREIRRADVNRAVRHILEPANHYFSAVGQLTRTDKQRIRAMFVRDGVAAGTLVHATSSRSA